jgi:thymidylate synthase ThyX
MANVGMTANARVEHLVRKMLSHPLAEVREIGMDVKRVAQSEVPTLVKYAERSAYLAETEAALVEQARAATRGAAAPAPSGAALVDYQPDAEERVIAALLVRYGAGDYAHAHEAAQAWPAEQRAAFLEEALGRLGQYDIPLREIEHVTYTFDVLLDQGAYSGQAPPHDDAKPQALTVDYGYNVPRAFIEAGLEARYRDAGARGRGVPRSRRISARGLVPGDQRLRRRVLMTMNLRGLPFLSPRAAASTHFSIRHCAGGLRGGRAVHPALAAYMRCEKFPAADEVAGEGLAEW